MKLGSNLQYLRKLHGNMTQEKLAASVWLKPPSQRAGITPGSKV